MRKMIKSVSIILTVCSLLTAGCEIKVDGGDGACEAHKFLPADCVSPAKCQICGFERGEPTGHDFTSEATCTKPKTCNVCGYTNGITVSHAYSEETELTATCERQGIIRLTCTECGEITERSYAIEKREAGDIFLECKASVCEIRVYSSSGNEISLGTGFAFESGGSIVTNYHVIHGGYSAKAIFDGRSYDIESVLAYDRDIDIAVLKISSAEITPLSVCKSDHPVGMNVYAFGSSQGLTATFSNGIITFDKRMDGGVEYIQHSAAVSSGNSGGPLINEYGEVIGINTFAIEDSQNLNFAVSVKELGELVYRSPKSLAEVSEAEQSVLTTMFEYTAKHGDYSDADNEYVLEMYKALDEDGAAYLRCMTYYPDYNTVSVRNTIYFESIDYGASAELFFDNTNGRYSWYYYDSRNQQLKGTLNAANASPDTKLSHSETNITDTKKLNSSLEVANSLMQIILQNLDGDLAEASLSAEDLGFVNY